MKWLKFAAIPILGISVLFAFQNCGGSSGSGDGGPNMASTLAITQLIGTWTNTSGTLSFDSSGVFSGNFCGSLSGKILSVSPDQQCASSVTTCGVMNVNVIASSGGVGCPPLGVGTCSYLTYNVYLTLNCGGGPSASQTFTRQ